MSNNDPNQKKVQKEIEKQLNSIRTDIRCDIPAGSHTKQEVLYPLVEIFRSYQDTSNINKENLNKVWNHVEKYYQYSQLFAEIFPYQQYFQIVSEHPDDAVKILALKQLSFFSQFEFFPYQEFIDSPFFSMFFTILQTSETSSVIDQILYIFTNILKKSPEFRDQFLEQGILHLLSEKLFSFRVPLFLETLILIDPPLSNEILEQLVPFYEYFLNLISETPKLSKIKTIRAALRSLCHLMKADIHIYDSIINKYIPNLLSSDDVKILCTTVRLIGLIQIPTIQFCEPCFNRIFNDIGDSSTFHTMLKTLIRKHDEWAGYNEDIINETILFHSTSDDGPFLKNLYLQTMLLYFPFNQTFDERFCSLLLFFLNSPSDTKNILTALQIMMSDATFEEGEKEAFVEQIEEEMDSFDLILHEGDQDTVLMASEFLKNFEEFKET